MSVQRTIRTRLYAEDLPLILETLEKNGCDCRFNSRITGFQRTFDVAVSVKGKYCLALSRVRRGDETFFQIHYDVDHLSATELKRWRGEFEARVKALQIKQKLSRSGYMLTGFEENSERIVLRIKEAV